MWRHLTTFYNLTSHTVTIPRTDRLNFFSTKDIIKRRKTETKAQHYWKRWLSDGKEFENVSLIGSLALLSGQGRSQGLFCTFSFEVIYQQRVRGFHQGFQTPGKRWKDAAVGRVFYCFNSHSMTPWSLAFHPTEITSHFILPRLQ